MRRQDRERFQKYLCELDEAQIICIQAQVKEEKRDVELILCDIQLRLDYLGVFTPHNITKLARSLEIKKAAEPPQNNRPTE